MPYISINVTKKLSENEKQALQLEVINNISIIPEKVPAHTTVCITDGCTMFKDGKPYEGGFVDVRLFKESPKDSKIAYSQKLFEVFTQTIGLPKENLHINYIQIFDWGTN